MAVADLVARALGPDVPLSIDAYDGSVVTHPHAVATIHVRSADALRRFATAPGELGLGRAYVAGDIDFTGELFPALTALMDHRPGPDAALVADLVKILGPSGLRPLPPPPEEAHLHGRKHSKERDAAAIAHHYDVSNEFYRIVLGPTLTYSCAVWRSPDVGLDAAQDAKHELVSRKLDLQPGMRLLDVGCGWGGMALHAARHHGASVVGVTISERQYELARERVKEEGLDDLVEIRLQDYRDVADGPYDAISSIGMFEHVGRALLGEYLGRLHALLRPGGRLLNHGISRPAQRRDSWPVVPPRTRFQRRSFIDRYVFPDGELHEVGTVVSAIQQAGFEVRHVESLREHYALTLRAWVANLEGSWDTAVAEAGIGRARVWRLYMAAAAVNFEANRTQIHQVLAVKTEGGASGLPLRPQFEDLPRTV
jgi:cyclopropane-fatty-acyl-phospholipid synthase